MRSSMKRACARDEACDEYAAFASPCEVELQRECRGPRAAIEPARPQDGASRREKSLGQARRDRSYSLLERAADTRDARSGSRRVFVRAAHVDRGWTVSRLARKADGAPMSPRQTQCQCIAD